MSDGYSVEVMALPGLGLEPWLWECDIIGHYAGLVVSALKHNDVKCIIAHGMGCTVARTALQMMRAMDYMWLRKLIFVSPYYKGVKKLGRLTWPGICSHSLFCDIRNSAHWTENWCHNYVKDSAKSDDMMQFDLRSADVNTAIILAKELVHNKVSATPHGGTTFIVGGTGDKFTSMKRVRMLSSDIHADGLTWLDCGHYPMVECYDDYISVIRRYVNA